MRHEAWSISSTWAFVHLWPIPQRTSEPRVVEGVAYITYRINNVSNYFFFFSPREQQRMQKENAVTHFEQCQIRCFGAKKLIQLFSSHKQNTRNFVG